MRKGRHVDRSVLPGQCVCLLHQTMSSVGNPPRSFFLCVVFQGLVELGRTRHTWVCVVRVQLGSWNGCECGGCLREKSMGVKNWTQSGLFFLISWARRGCEELLMRWDKWVDITLGEAFGSLAKGSLEASPQSPAKGHL